MTAFLTESLEGDYPPFGENRLTQLTAASFNHSQVFRVAFLKFIGARNPGNAATYHDWAPAILPQLKGSVRTCEAVVAEALHPVDNTPAAIAALHRLLSRMEIVPVLREDFEAVFSMVSKYAPRMDLADGCLVTLSARYAEAVVVTTDTRDFSSYGIPFASHDGLFA